MLVDSHCHLDRLQTVRHGEPLEPVLDAARGAGVEHMLCVGVDLESWPGMMELVAGEDMVSTSVGIHPNAGPEHMTTAQHLQELAGHQQVVAIGETGLDYFRTGGVAGFQRERFREHIRAAKSCRLPLIVHTRAARDDTLRIMREEGADGVGGVMHCFTEDWEMAREAMDMGFLVSFSGIVTFRNATDLQEVARKVPEDRILVETDSPWLAPEPNRGKPNQPAWVRHVADFVAGLRGVSTESLAATTTANYDAMFGRWNAPGAPD